MIAEEKKRSKKVMSERHYAGKKNKEKAERVEMQAYKFRGYPCPETEKVLWRNINCSRGFWNILCRDGAFLYCMMNIRLKSTPADYKDASGYEWLKEADSLALANVQMKYERAMDAFFAGDAGYPKIKRKRRCRDSYTTNCSNNKKPNLYIKDGFLKLPKVEGMIRLNLHRKVREGGILKNCTVAHEVDGWYFSLQFEYPRGASETETPGISEEEIRDIRHIGLDMSIPKLYVDNNGNAPGYIRPYRQAQERLAKEQRKLSRKIEANIDHYEVRGKKRYPVYKRPLEECRNIQRQMEKVRKIHTWIRRLREDILHKLSAELTDAYDVISIEDLNMAAMKRSLKLGKSASDIGWGKFSHMLKYKQERKGHRLIKVGRFFPSSRTCSTCGYIHKELTLSDRTYICPECGNHMDRDHQAAVNIDREGMEIFMGEVAKKAA